MHIKVENGATKGRVLRELPKVHTFADGSKTGNFDSMDTATHVAEGYYPLEEVKPTYDHRIERLTSYADDIQAAKVVRTWTKESISIEVLKSQKIRKIENYEASLAGNSLFRYDDKTWTLSAESASNVDGLQTAMSLPGATFPNPFSWTDADGNEVPMSEAYFQGFAGTMLVAKLTIAGASKTHKAAVSALTEPLDVVEYDYRAGWGNYVPPAPEGDPV
jgi:hypothetical protein